MKDHIRLGDIVKKISGKPFKDGSLELPVYGFCIHSKTGYSWFTFKPKGYAIFYVEMRMCDVVRSKSKN